MDQGHRTRNNEIMNEELNPMRKQFSKTMNYHAILCTYWV